MNEISSFLLIKDSCSSYKIQKSINNSSRCIEEVPEKKLHFQFISQRTLNLVRRSNTRVWLTTQCKIVNRILFQPFKHYFQSNANQFTDWKFILCLAVFRLQSEPAWITIFTGVKDRPNFGYFDYLTVNFLRVNRMSG